jgi:hypothetical protein
MENLVIWLTINLEYPLFFVGAQMAIAYKKAVKDFESAVGAYGFASRPTKVAKKRLAEIESDIVNFIKIVGGHFRLDVAEKRTHSERDIADSKKKIKDANELLKKYIEIEWKAAWCG